MDYKTYWTRWLLLAVGSASVLSRTYVSRGFAIINNVIANYFQVDPSAVDLLAIGDTISASFFSICIALMGNRLRLRSLFLAQGITMFLGTTLSTIGFISRDFYWVVAIGRILMGIQEAIIYILPTLLAAHWFRDRELASVFSIQMFALCIGGLACSFIFPNALPYAGLFEKNSDSMNATSEPYVTLTTMTSQTNDDIARTMSQREVTTFYINSDRETKTIFPNMTSFSTSTDDATVRSTRYTNGMFNEDLLTFSEIPRMSHTFAYTEQYMSYADKRLRLMLCFGMTSFIMFFAVILTFFHCQDNPPTPPSAAQEKILKSGRHSYNQSFRENFKEILKLAKNRTYVLLCCIMFLSGSLLLLVTFLSSFLLETFPDLSNRTPGIMLTITYVMAGVGSLLGGKLCDKLKSCKVILLINQIGVILCCIWVYLGHLLRNLPSLFIAYPLGIFLFSSSFTAMNEFVMESTYPINKIISTSVFYAFYNMGVYVSTFFLRGVQELYDETWAVFVLTPINAIALVLLILTKPIYRRTEIEKEAKSYQSEALTLAYTEC